MTGHGKGERRGVDRRGLERRARDRRTLGERLDAVLDITRQLMSVTDLDALLRQALNRLSVKDAVAEIAAVSGMPRREVYRRAIERPVGVSLAAGGDVVLTTRTQLPADETEWRLLLLARRAAPVKILARAVLGVAVALLRVGRRR